MLNSHWLRVMGVTLSALALVMACGDVVETTTANDATPSSSSVSSASQGGHGVGAGGAAGKGGEAGGDQGGERGQAGEGGEGGAGGVAEVVCAIECSTLAVPPCMQSVCNQGMFPGPVGQCVSVPLSFGTPCDDNTFCTANDTCNGLGVCVGGPQNECGMIADDCHVVTCDETSMSCSQVPGMNGAPCQNPQNLCILNSTCSNGACVGGVLNDCFFFPLPDQCHFAQCDPMNGTCQALPITQCISNDSCCPNGCTVNNDSDCP